MTSAPAHMPRSLRALMFATDVGFLAYWLITLARVVPPSYLFKDYADPLVVAWNWSFFPLDLAISSTGLTSLWLHRRSDPRWRGWTLISLSLTSCSGLMAVSYWALRADFAVSWWLPNLFLLVYPVVFVRGLLCAPTPR